jgi:DNA-binding response OmpR family regulator
MKHIFILEDNESLGKSLEERLTQEGYAVVWAKTVAEAGALFAKSPVDLAILDVSLPDGSGFEFARTVVQPGRTPIIFLSAFSSAEYRLEGYDSGAADYIPKPFHLRELLLRVEKVLKSSAGEKTVTIGSFVLNLDERSLRGPGGEAIFLAPREFDLLQFLIAIAPRVVSREEILEKVWGDDHTGSSTRTVDNTIVKLRQILGDEGTRRIRSVRGIGYQWIKS